MLLQWIERNEFGEEVVKNHSSLNTDNVGSYAKQTCHTCWGKGWNTYDDDWEYYLSSPDKDENNFYDVQVYQVMDRKPINPRVIACDCVCRKIERLGGLQ